MRICGNCARETDHGEPCICKTRQTKVRRNAKCPRCGYHAATFFVKGTNGQALLRCNNIESRRACGHVFDAPHPQPLAA